MLVNYNYYYLLFLTKGTSKAHIHVVVPFCVYISLQESKQIGLLPTDLPLTALSPVRFFHEALKVLHHNTPSCGGWRAGVKMIEGTLATFVQTCAR